MAESRFDNVPETAANLSKDTGSGSTSIAIMIWLNRFEVGVAGALGTLSEALPTLLGQLLYRFFDRPLDPPIVESAGDDHGRAKPNEAATRRGCGSSADDGWSSLRESKEEEVPRQILGGTSASVASIEFEPGLDRLVDPFRRSA